MQEKILIMFMNIYNARKKTLINLMNIYNARKILINFMNICNARKNINIVYEYLQYKKIY